MHSAQYPLMARRIVLFYEINSKPKNVKLRLMDSFHKTSTVVFHD